ncbi:Cytochrome C' [Planctomycetes bacterium Pla86]|uniref:Cytochrome C n=2 Tax=Engelhardtia mirabilis TaxID=2528011 RepID=A0A518BDJ2_9BACT|nr:Cytochrome C' [Planctomycetes bacterium Pla133]QDU99362.1 Cytochrome C' [Planctomycetes bacterium Pla86]
MPPQFLFARAVLLSAGAASALASCGGGAADPFEPLPSRDLTMLELMIELNPPYLGMQSELRNVERLGDLAAAADMVATLAEDPRMTGYTAREDFARDPAPFERMRQDLLTASRAAADSARAGDLDGLHDAYAQMSASCVACHKRYSPHQ